MNLNSSANSKVSESGVTITRHILKVSAIILGVSLAGYLLEMSIEGNEAMDVTFEILAELFSIFVSYSIFGVTWYAYGRSRDNHALFLGTAFFVIGFIDLFHVLSYPFMPDFITLNPPEKSAVFWNMARTISALLFLASAYLYKDTLPRLITRPVLFGSAIALSFISLIAGVFYHDYLPATYHVEGGISILKIIQVLITATLILYASYLYTRRISEKNFEIFLIYGFIIVFFSDLIYFSHETSGHLLKVAGFYYIYIALYESSVELPYEKLALAEEKLRQAAEEKYRNLFDNANDAIIIHDLEGRVISWNHAAEKIFGWTEEEIIGKELLSRIVPEELRVEIERAACSIVPEGVTGFETAFLRKDRNRIDASLTTSALRDANQNIIGISCIIRDITEHKQAEEARAQSEEKYRTLVEESQDGIFIIQDAKIQFVNEAFARMAGYAMEDCIGKDFRELVAPEDLDMVVNRYFRRQAGEDIPGEYEFHVLRKDGTRITVNMNVGLISYRGKIASMGTIKDITELKKAEELRLENERLVLANRAKSEFLSTMSHELRTPLNVVLGFSELLKQKTFGELNEKQKNFVDNIVTGGKNLLNVISDILDMTGIEAEKLELVTEKISVPEAIKEALAPIKEVAAKRNIVIRTDCDPALDFIEADKKRFNQILSNLLNNAVKFSKPEGGTVTITARKEGDMAKLSVSDTGIGIKEDDLGGLFIPFRQIESGMSRRYGGTGLGLAITKQLVELHGGTIKAESKFGEGSIFTFLLPIEAKKLQE